MSKLCTDPQMEFLILKEISISNAEKRPMKLSPENEQHLQECERCRRMLPEWVEKVATWKNP